MKRREFLKKSLQTTTIVTLSNTLLNKAFANKKVLTYKTGNPLRFPPVLIGNDLTLSKINYNIFPNATTEVYAMNNSYLAPTVLVEKGNYVSVNFTNQLTNEDVTIHWHGLILPELMDGHPKDPIHPGNNYTYTFPVINNAGTYFYHAHTHELTAKQVYQGFAGFFIVTDSNESQLGLPTGNFDIPLVFQDHRAQNIPQFTYNPSMAEVMDGFLGDIVLVNGTYDPYFEISKTLYRFRLLNGSNARVYKIAFSNNQNFYVIGNDGGLIDTPILASNIFLAPGERADILVDFSNLQIGENMFFKSLSFPASGMGTQYIQGTEMNLLRLDVVSDTQSNGIIPQTLFPIQRYDENDIVNTRSFVLTMSMGGGGMHKINNKIFDMNRIDEEINLGDLEMWQVVNLTDEFHPIHIHGIQFQVLERSSGSLSPTEVGWKDTILVNPNETVKLFLKFSDYTGLFLIHCHNLEHEDDGMMLNIRINDPNSIKENDSENNEIKISSNRNLIQFNFQNLKEENSIQIFDVIGKKIFEDTIPQNGNSYLLNSQKFSNGIYFGHIGKMKFKFSIIK